MREVFSAIDYPTEAIANEEQGTVHAWLLITADGRVQRCGIRQSSGSAALDAQTCDLFIAKAQFRPARGKGGSPVASIHERQLTWRLEGGPPNIGNQIVKEHFTVGPNGEVRCNKAEFRIAANQWMEAKEAMHSIRREGAASASGRQEAVQAS